MAGKPFVLRVSTISIYNVFGWKNTATGYRRINTVYDKRAKER
jgi:hypothetical protein